MSLDLTENYVSIIAAVFGGIGVKLLERLSAKRSEKFSEAVRIREELRLEVNTLREELDELKQEVSVWREKYYQKVEEALRTLAEIELMRTENAALHRRIDELFNLNT